MYFLPFQKWLGAALGHLGVSLRLGSSYGSGAHVRPEAPTVVDWAAFLTTVNCWLLLADVPGRVTKLAPCCGCCGCAGLRGRWRKPAF